MKSTLKGSLSVLAAFAVASAVATPPARAVVVHRYTFNDGNANDSVGTAHGTVVDAGAPTAVFSAGGQLDLSANNGQTSGAYNALPAAAAPTEDAYVDLPNLIIENASKGGVSGAYSLEFWFTVSTHRTWQWIGGFAGPRIDGVPSEGVINQGDVQYMLISPSSGRNNQGIEISADYGIPGTLVGQVLGQSGPAQPALPPNLQHHVVATYDKNNTSSGANPGGTMALYLNGVNVLPGQPNVNGGNAIPEGFNPNDFNDEDNWLGRANWNDPLFDGSYNEFSIYDHALTQAEVTTNFNTGPVPVPLPTLIVNTVTGATAIRNLATGTVAIDYYEIASPGNRLNAAPGAWNSLDDQNLGASLAADFNDSNTVDGADLTVWKGAYGTNANGDADGDGDTDGNDLIKWQQQVGQTPGGAGGWAEAGGSGDNLLVELNLEGSSSMAPNAQLNLGNAFRPGGAQDLTFKFAIDGEGGLTTGTVQYVTTGPAVSAPEPAGAALASMALLAVGAARRRRQAA
jgi:hypothetical protein